VIIFDVPGLLRRIEKLELEMAKSEFWQDTERAKAVTKEASAHKAVVERWQNYKKEIDGLQDLIALCEEAEDTELSGEIAESLRKITKDVEVLELESLLAGEDDSKDAILAIHPGAGGTESQDWAQMLMRMYLRWAERRQFEPHVMDLLPGDEAGIKSATIEVKGTYAYGYLKAEIGVHRLVRISPFDANHRRHTSFASVFVFAEAEDDLEIDVKDSDLRVDTFRASGAGGQHVNKTDSAVRITHLPTKIVVQCQSERSQRRNRDNAMKILKAKLHAHQLEEEKKKLEEIEKSKMDIAWGSQIRSYILQPYTLVKDHRTGIETGNVDDVLDGNIDDFIEGFLRSGDGNQRGKKHERNN
jgi:peptide chain release factor 2